MNVHIFEFVVMDLLKWTPGSFPRFLSLLISTEVIILQLVGVESERYPESDGVRRKKRLKDIMLLYISSQKTFFLFYPYFLLRCWSLILKLLSETSRVEFGDKFSHSNLIDKRNTETFQTFFLISLTLSQSTVTGCQFHLFSMISVLLFTLLKWQITRWLNVWARQLEWHLLISFIVIRQKCWFQAL